MLYDPKWDRREWEERLPGVPLRSRSLLMLMVAMPWIMLFGMVGLTLNTVSHIQGHILDRHIGR